MRLLILTPEYDQTGGGIVTFYRALVSALQHHDLEIRIIEGSAFHSASQKSVRQRNGASVETLETGRMYRWYGRFSHLAPVPGLRRHLAASWAMWEQSGFGEDADVVEACDWGLLFVPPALHAVKPLIVQCHGSIGQVAEHDPISGEEMQDALVRLIEGVVLAGNDAIQTSSCDNSAYWRQRTGREVTVIRPAWSRPGVATQPTTTRGLVVGRVQRWKGPEVLCSALDTLNHGSLEFDWIGQDTPFDNRGNSTVRHLCKKYPGSWGRTITHHLPESPEQVYRRQAAALFNLVPSTWDVFNFTVAEAMASGRPTVVSTGAGASELVEDGVNGFTFPGGDPEKLAATIDRVLSQTPRQLAAIGSEAQNTIRRVLDPQLIAGQRRRAYEAATQTFCPQRALSLYKPLQEICHPGNATALNEYSFLEQLPLRTLVQHVGARVVKKTGQAVANNR